MNLPTSQKYTQTCSFCSKPFDPSRKQTRYCSPACRMEAHIVSTRQHRRLQRHQRNCTIPCQVCSFDQTTDIHHEGEDLYILCPNHHALITRGISSIQDYNLSPHPKEKVDIPIVPRGYESVKDFLKRAKEKDWGKLKKVKQPKQPTCPHGNVVCGICTKEGLDGKSNEKETPGNQNSGSQNTL